MIGKKMEDCWKRKKSDTEKGIIFLPVIFLPISLLPVHLFAKLSMRRPCELPIVLFAWLLLTAVIAPPATASCFEVIPLANRPPPSFRCACTNDGCSFEAEVFNGVIFILMPGTSCDEPCSLTNATVTGGTLVTNLITQPPDFPQNGGLMIIDSILLQTPGATNGELILEFACVTFRQKFAYPDPIAIDSQPASLQVLVGDEAGFSVLMQADCDSGYQWQKDGVKLSETDRITGADSANLSIIQVQPSDAGGYTVVVTNSSGSVTSLVATLTVGPAAKLEAPAFSMDSGLQFTVSGAFSHNYVVQANFDLTSTNWISLLTNAAPFVFTDPMPSDVSRRFYRALYAP